MGKPIRSSGVQKSFKRLINLASLPNIRFHDLRHTAASLLLAKNIPILELSRLLGHSRPSITLDIYGHLVPSLESDALDRLDQSFIPTAAELQRSGDFDNFVHVRDEERFDEMPEFPSKSV